MIVLTRGVSYHCEKDHKFFDFVQESLRRFLNGDWGNVGGEDRALNDAEPAFALGAYADEQNQEVWIKRDEGTITILFPSEY
ncbi:hypothetical protein FYJ34_06755 [Clostridiaceae bacterium 68-1-5]|uniref:Uncharacterized protein n=1 Tax=Suipraeoptans intestinalis TaxID=2606628 RepID=A0A6N7V1F3_9FIRM|nr:hypothetical protein [Suipraeoptans intestinalis]MSR92830.1 hypothetical protein [Suipraeoptans intestinalis]MSR93960.1 hypothetical protein [Suipraeoptans intestinalis]